MNHWTQWTLAAMLVAASAVVTTPAAAQRTIDGGLGAELRWHGDTIWRIRDTTEIRTIFRGDTVRRSFSTNGRVTATVVQRVRGDVVETLEQRGERGELVEWFTPGRTQPLFAALGERLMIENALRDQAMRVRLPNIPMPPRDAPMRPTTRQTYVLSVNQVAEHLGDTVRYIRGCTAAPPIDTTVYLFVGEDSLQRLSPNPRAFGRPMARAVRGDLSSSMVRQRVSAMGNAAAMADVPGPPRWPCERR